MKLTGEEEARIELQEKYRDEVRRKLDAAAEKQRKDKEKAEEAEKKKTPVWSFLNSSFGLLLIGSVVLTGLVAGVGEVWRAWVASRKDLRDVDKILLEVSDRVLRAQNKAIEIDNRRGPDGRRATPTDADRPEVLDKLRWEHAPKSSETDKEAAVVYTFAEYRDSSVQNLLYQVGVLGNKKHREKATQVTVVLSNAVYDLEKGGVTTNIISNFSEAIRECKRQQSATWWKFWE